jgi:hypothetical protein
VGCLKTSTVGQKEAVDLGEKTGRICRSDIPFSQLLPHDVDGAGPAALSQSDAGYVELLELVHLRRAIF